MVEVALHLRTIRALVRGDVSLKCMCRQRGTDNEDSALYAYLTDSNRELRLTVEECAMSDLVEAIVLGSVIIIVEVILLIRGESHVWVQHTRYSLRSTTVYALYERSRPVLLGLLGGFATHICVTACGVLYTMKEFDYNIECLSSTAPRIVLLMWSVECTAGSRSCADFAWAGCHPWHSRQRYS